jgi:hypothetical protein
MLSVPDDNRPRQAEQEEPCHEPAADRTRGVTFHTLPPSARERPIPLRPRTAPSQAGEEGCLRPSMAASGLRVSKRRGPGACRGSSPASHDTRTSTAATAGPRAPRQAKNDSVGHQGSLAPSVPHYTLTASLSESGRCHNHENRPDACVDVQRRCSTTSVYGVFRPSRLTVHVAPVAPGQTGPQPP